MKQILLKILKGFVIFVVLALVVLLVFAITRMHLNWPLWVGIFILTGMLGLWVGFIVLRKIFQRRSEDKFVRQIINQDTAYITDFGDKARKNAQEVQERWKEAIDVLKKSHLKKKGNPMYVLPWYMIIGESGSGKTTAIESAGLSGIFSEITRTSGIYGTRNCDWWFFEKAIIIDTAGRYAIPVDEGRDKEEWRKFLTHLVKYRKKEPLNGLIVTIGADKLMESGTEVLEKDGKDIRRRIQELMQGLGSKFPIYVLVTKCDLVKGMTQFCDLFPEKSIKQAMGFVNSDLSADVGTFLKNAMTAIGERLRDQRLLLFQKAGTGRIDPSLLLFPEEFEKLEPGLNTFIRGAFQETPYQETPILRGAYFSSGRQEGSPYSHFLNSLGLIGEREVLPGTNKGLFLFDIFSRILPGDRQLYAPTLEARRLGLLTRNLGLVSWVAIMIAVCGLLSFSFGKNLTILNYVGKYGKPPELTESDLTNVKLIDDFREAILEVEKKNRKWWLPRFGLNKSIEVEQGLKARYCELVNVRFLEKVDLQVAGRVNHFDEKTPDRVIGHHAAFLVRRINLMKTMLEKGKLEELQKKPQPSFGSVMTSSAQEITPELDKKIQDLYLYYLLWWDDRVRFSNRKTELQALLTHIVTKKRTDLNWIAGWINDDPSLIFIYLADFWGGARKASGDEKYIEPAFTLEGNQKKDSFIAELDSAISDPLDIAGKVSDFGEWYKDSYITAWYDFGKYFPKGKEKLGVDEWRYLAVRMDSDNGPYFSLLDVMNDELEPFKDEDSAMWVTHVRDLKNVKLQAVTLEKKGAAAGAKRTGKRIINRIGSKIGIRGGGKMLDGAVSEAAKNFKDYQDSLTVIGPISDDRKLAYEKTLEVFTESASVSNSPFYKAKRAYKSLLKNMGDIKSDQKMFRDLLYGPLEFLWEYACNETSCRLQSDWSKTVWWEIQNENDPERLCYLLFGDQKGFVNQYVESKDGAGAFMTRDSSRAYKPKWALGKRIPFKKGIFPFLVKGKQIKDRIRGKQIVIPEEPEEPPPVISEPAPKPLPASYNVSIKGMPTGINAGAAYKPALTVLELYCADKTTGLENRNYPVSEVFTWTPETCREVVLKIDLEGLVLTKNYRGEKAFQSFIRDFRSGRRVFTPRDFPRHETTMQELNIRKIDVNYKLSGDVQGVLSYRSPREKRPPPRPRKKKKVCIPPPVPKVIVECWD